MSEPSPHPAPPGPGGPPSNRWVIFVFTTVALALLASVSVGTWLAVRSASGRRPQAARAGERPNLVLVVFESLRPQSLLPHDGGASTPAPACEQMARRGTRARAAWAPAGRSDAVVVSLLTGLSPPCHGTQPLAEIKTLPQRLREQGYATGAVVGIAKARDLFGLAPQFDFYRAQGSIGHELAHLIGLGQAPVVSSTILTQQAGHFISQNAQRPFFLYVHYADTRLPYGGAQQSPRRHFFKGSRQEAARLRQVLRERPCRLSAKERAGASDLYDDALAASDAQLGVLKELLAEQGILKETFLVLTGARGDPLGGRGCAGGGRSPRDEDLRVPLLFEGPGIAAGRTLEGPANLLDLPPTLASLAGAKVAESWAGRDLSACLTGSQPCPPATPAAEPAHCGEALR